MDIADNPMSFVTVDPLDAFADDCGAQMTDVERLCNVGAAVIDNDGFFLFGSSTPNFSAAAISFKYSQTKLSFTFRFKIRRKPQILQKILRCPSAFPLHRWHHDRGFMVFFCARHRTVTLIFAQIGTVGHGYASPAVPHNLQLQSLFPSLRK